MSLLTEKSEASTLVELAITKLRQDILAGVFAPGSKLRVEELRSSYEIGASPLREALSRLVSNGLVRWSQIVGQFGGEVKVYSGV